MLIQVPFIMQALGVIFANRSPTIAIEQKARCQFLQGNYFHIHRVEIQGRLQLRLAAACRELQIERRNELGQRSLPYRAAEAGTRWYRVLGLPRGSAKQARSEKLEGS